MRSYLNTEVFNNQGLLHMMHTYVIIFIILTKKSRHKIWYLFISIYFLNNID